MRMTEYPEASAVASSDVLIIDGQDGNRKLPASKALEPLLKHGTSTNGHRVIPECKFLGNSITNAQAQAIYDGSFDGLHVGDYWTISGHNWRIWDFDYWLHESNNVTHHIVVLPDDCLYDAKMEDTNITTNGYAGSKMRTTYLNDAKTLINSIFGDLIFAHNEYLTNASSNGKASGTVNIECTIEIPQEIMFYGCRLASSSMPIVTTILDYDVGHNQLLLAKLMPEFVNIYHDTWFRDIHSSERFAFLHSDGRGSIGRNSSTASGVRPVFGVKGRVAG